VPSSVSAGARVIEETSAEKLPEGFQRAEYLRDHGMNRSGGVARRVARHLIRIVDLLRPSMPPAEVFNLPVPSAGETHGQISAS